MKTMDTQAFEEIRAWVHRNARALELALWQFHFEGGSREAVLSELAFYQNADGGFGHALEADNWNPHSTPVATQTAVNLLQSIGFCDPEHPVIQGILRYLRGGDSFENNRWLFCVPSNDDFPHAPWWNYSPETNRVETTGVTADLTAFLLRHLDQGSELYSKMLAIAHSLLRQLLNESSLGDMGVAGCIHLMQTLQELEIGGFDLPAAQTRLHQLVHDTIEHDTAKWASYGVRPSNYIRSPESPFYADNREIVEAELDYLIDTRPAQQVWGITWTWFGNGDKYPKEFAISENWWKSEKAIEKLLLLRSFGRLAAEPPQAIR